MSYDELDAERRPLRHVEMRADDGTYLAAAARAEMFAARQSGGVKAVTDYETRYGVVPEAPLPPLGDDVREMAASSFEEVWRLARCQLDGRAEVWIDRVRPSASDGIAVVVRCVGGRVRVGSRLDRVRETGEQVSLTVVRILRWEDVEVDELRPAETAMLILSDTGSARLLADRHLDGRTR